MGIIFQVAKLHNNFLTAENELSTPPPSDSVTIRNTVRNSIKTFFLHNAMPFLLLSPAQNFVLPQAFPAFNL